jgi:calcineurin-like phosphoesterase
VGTVDTKVMPRGTAYVSEVGMAGAADSVIGDDTDLAIRRFLTLMPHRLTVGKGHALFNSVLVEVEDDSGKALSITRLDLELREQ